MKLAAWFGIAVGSLMIIQWGYFLGTGQVPELQVEPLRIYFHLASEFITAIGLLVSGIALRLNKPWGKTSYTIATGMLLYSVIVSPGYFAQQGQWAPVGMFCVLLILALLSLRDVIHSNST